MADSGSVIRRATESFGGKESEEGLGYWPAEEGKIWQQLIR